MAMLLYKFDKREIPKIWGVVLCVFLVSFAVYACRTFIAGAHSGLVPCAGKHCGQQIIDVTSNPERYRFHMHMWLSTFNVMTAGAVYFMIRIIKR